MRKLRSSKKVEILQVILVLQVESWRNAFFVLEERNGVFCYFHHEIIFYYQLCWNIYMFLNINTNETSKEEDLDFIRSSLLFWEKPQRGALEVNCQAGNFILLAFLRILVTFFRSVCKVGKIFRCVTSFYQHFFVSDKISYYKTNSDKLV